MADRSLRKQRPGVLFLCCWTSRQILPLAVRSQTMSAASACLTLHADVSSLEKQKKRSADERRAPSLKATYSVLEALLARTCLVAFRCCAHFHKAKRQGKSQCVFSRQTRHDQVREPRTPPSLARPVRPWPAGQVGRGPTPDAPAVVAPPFLDVHVGTGMRATRRWVLGARWF